MTAVISAYVKKLSKLVNFCVSILILKMEKIHIFGMLCFIISRKVKTTEMQKKDLCSVRRRYVTDRTCQKWFVKFRAEAFSLDNAPWLGRPGEVDSNEIKTLTEDNQHYTTQETANILTISKSIKLLVKIKHVFLWQKPYGLFGQHNVGKSFLSNMKMLNKHVEGTETAKLPTSPDRSLLRIWETVNLTRCNILNYSTFRKSRFIKLIHLFKSHEILLRESYLCISGFYNTGNV